MAPRRISETYFGPEPHRPRLDDAAEAPFDQPGAVERGDVARVRDAIVFDKRVGAEMRTWMLASLQRTADDQS